MTLVMSEVRGMRKFCVVIAAISCLLGGAFGEENDADATDPVVSKISQSAEAAVENLLKTLNFERVYEHANWQQLEDLFTQNPTLARYAEEIKNFYARYCRYELLKPRIVELYAKTFNEDEVKELTAFFRTSAGRKWIENYPSILRQIRKLGEQQAQKYRGELQKIIDGNSDNAVDDAVDDPADSSAKTSPTSPVPAGDDDSQNNESPDDQW